MSMFLLLAGLAVLTESTSPGKASIDAHGHHHIHHHAHHEANMVRKEMPSHKGRTRNKQASITLSPRTFSVGCTSESMVDMEASKAIPLDTEADSSEAEGLPVGGGDRPNPVLGGVAPDPTFADGQDDYYGAKNVKKGYSCIKVDVTLSPVMMDCCNLQTRSALYQEFKQREQKPAHYSEADISSVAAFAAKMGNGNGCPTGKVPKNMAHVCEGFYTPSVNPDTQQPEYRVCRYIDKTSTCEYVGDTCIKDLMEDDKRTGSQCIA